MFCVRLPLIAAAGLATGCSIQTAPYTQHAAGPFNSATKIANVGKPASVSAAANVAPGPRKLIGKWTAANRPITIYRTNGKTYIRQGLGNGKTVTKRLTPFRHKLGPAYQHKSEHWIIDRDGDLQVWNEEGYQSAAQPAV